MAIYLGEEHVDLGQKEVLRQQYGLDKPYWQQYSSWLHHTLRGDMGVSYADGRPVKQIVEERSFATFLLTGTAFTLGLLLAFLGGILAALYRNSFLDKLISASSFCLLSTPSFLFSLLLLQIFSLYLGWLPSGGMLPLGSSEQWNWQYLFLPAFTLACYYANGLVLLIRKSMGEVLQQDYIRTAYAVGLQPSKVILGYALPNALLPIISLVAMSLPRLFSGAFVVETVFAWPGMGRLVVQAANQRDYPVLLIIVLVISILVIVSNFLAQLFYQLADPRIRFSQNYGGD